MIEVNTDKALPDSVANGRPRGRPRRKSKKPPFEPKPCITSGCHRPMQGRGLCKSCYWQASKLIKAGETTWAELESMGLAFGKSKALFAVEFRKRKAELREEQTS